MAESLTAVQFFGFLVKIPIAESLTAVHFFLFVGHFIALQLCCGFVPPRCHVSSYELFFLLPTPCIISSVYLFLFSLFFFSETEISPECWSHPLFAMHSLFFFFFICCSLWSLHEDLTEPLGTFSPVRVVSFHSSFYSFCVFSLLHVLLRKCTPEKEKAKN